MSGKYVASVSFGKDSLAMVLYILETGMPLDEVLFYDTGMEFDAIYNNRNKLKKLLAPPELLCCHAGHLPQSSRLPQFQQ